MEKKPQFLFRPLIVFILGSPSILSELTIYEKLPN